MIKSLSLVLLITFLDSAYFISAPITAETTDQSGVSLALKFSQAATRYVRNLNDKSSSDSTSDAAWDFAKAAAEYLNYTQSKDQVGQNNFLKNPNPLTNTKRLENVLSQTKIKAYPKLSNTEKIIFPVNSASNQIKTFYHPSFNAIFNQNMAQYYLQKKQMKAVKEKEDKEKALKTTSGNKKEKIQLLRARRPVSKVATSDMTVQTPSRTSNNYQSTPALNLKITSSSHAGFSKPSPQSSVQHQHRVAAQTNQPVINYQLKPLSLSNHQTIIPVNMPPSGSQFLSYQPNTYYQPQPQPQNVINYQATNRPIQNFQTYQPYQHQYSSPQYSPSQAQTPVLSYASAPPTKSSYQGLHYPTAQTPVLSYASPNSYQGPQPQPLYYQQSARPTLWPNLFNVPHFNIGDLLERGRASKVKEAEEKSKNLNAKKLIDEEDDEVENDENEDEEEEEEGDDGDNLIVPDVRQLSIQRPVFTRFTQYEHQSPQNLNDFVKLRPSLNFFNAPHFANMGNLLERGRVSKFNEAELEKSKNLRTIKSIDDEVDEIENKENEDEEEEDDADDEDETLVVPDVRQLSIQRPVFTQHEDETAHGHDKLSHKDEVELLEDELNKCLSMVDGDDASKRVKLESLEICLEILYSESEPSNNPPVVPIYDTDKKKEPKSIDDIVEKFLLL